MSGIKIPKASTSETGKSPRSHKKRRKITKKRNDIDEEDRQMKNLIQKKFQKKRKDEESSVIKIQSNTVSKLVNSAAHNNVITRAEENQMNRMYQVDTEPSLSSKYVCAICQERACRDPLGDLFGPYYVSIDDDNWPEFLVPKPKGQKNAGRHLLDAWVHGECALWSPGLFLCSRRIENLERQLHLFWKQNCHACHKKGASIPVQSRTLHFPCALKGGFEMNKKTYTVTCSKAA